MLDPTYKPPSNYAYKNTNLEDKIDVPQVDSFNKTIIYIEYHQFWERE